MKTFFRSILFSLTFFVFISPLITHAQAIDTPAHPDEYLRGTILQISPPETTDDFIDSLQKVRVKVKPKNATTYEVDAEFNNLPQTTTDDLHVGEEVIVLKSFAFNDEVRYLVTDKYRLPSLAWLVAIFFAVAVIFAGIRGITSTLGLGFSLLVLLGFTVPRIVAGADPFITAIISAFVIAIVSLTVAHGFKKQTGLALISTLITLSLSVGLAQFFVTTAKLLGLGTEDALYLQFGGMGTINFRGLLLAGIVIGVLGVLDDVTTAQTATIKAIKDTSPTIEFKQLLFHGLSVGREHITSLVNTLALAYAGASLPLLLAFSSNGSNIPLWAVLNSEMISQEIVRTLVGSTALILAVPISTVVSAFYYGRLKRNQ
ncbi:MAG: YibE/F family protein [Patescibacteria group bacterium]